MKKLKNTSQGDKIKYQKNNVNKIREKIPETMLYLQFVCTKKTESENKTIKYSIFIYFTFIYFLFSTLKLKHLVTSLKISVYTNFCKSMT